jgi:YD repeat-containing protein
LPNILGKLVCVSKQVYRVQLSTDVAQITQKQTYNASHQLLCQTITEKGESYTLVAIVGENTVDSCLTSELDGVKFTHVDCQVDILDIIWFVY